MDELAVWQSPDHAWSSEPYLGFTRLGICSLQADRYNRCDISKGTAGERFCGCDLRSGAGEIELLQVSGLVQG